MIQLLSDKTVLLALSFLGGVVLQCFIFLRERPKKWTVYVLAGMMAYMVFLMFVGSDSDLAQSGAEKKIELSVSIILSLSVVFGMIYIMVFLNHLMRVIDKHTVYALSLTYWFLLYHYSEALSVLAVVLLSVVGFVATVAVFFYVYFKRSISKVGKVFFYAWYLFVNAVFAFLYITELPYEFMTSGGRILNGNEEYGHIILLGMTVVLILFNVGLLYYTAVYSIFSADVRRRIIDYSSVMFSDANPLRSVVYIVTFLHITGFVLLLILPEKLASYTVSYWFLIMPLIILSLKKLPFLKN